MRFIGFLALALTGFTASAFASDPEWTLLALNVTSGDGSHYQFDLSQRAGVIPDLKLSCYFREHSKIDREELPALERYCKKMLRKHRRAKVVSISSNIIESGSSYQAKTEIFAQSR